jgi:hypothetical protein
MISGRGLGHTGGTLDKLESIPGFRTNLTEDQLRGQMKTTPCAIVSASAEIAPADRRLYLIRDVTGTVESIDLITASILSKKLAAGLEGLVLDVKVGSGAFMKTMDEANTLARALVATAQGAGCMTTALITDMSQPLATAAGNALEVIEVMETLTGTSVNEALWDLTAALGGEALALGGLAADPQDGARRIDAALENGQAAEMFGRMVAAQGGPADFVDRWPDRLPSAPVQREVPCLRDGFVTAIDGALIGAALYLVGLNFALLIGLAVCLLALIPYVGLTICWIPAVLIAVAQFGDWTHPLIVTAIFVGMSNVESFFIAPRVVGSSVSLHPLTVILSALVWSLILGVLLGSLLAVPLTATIKVVLQRYVWHRQL